MRLSTAAVSAALTVPILLASAACTTESERAADRTRATSSSTATATATDGTSPAPTYPTFAAEDYSYHLEVICFCPQTGTVEVVVQDGEVAGATVVDGPQAGMEAPEFTELTINDILEQAHAPGIATTDIDWPDGEDHPRSVMIDRIAQGVDDEVTYTIKNVQVTPQG